MLENIIVHQGKAHTSQSPVTDRKGETTERLMRIWRIVSHAIRPAPSPPEASRSTALHPLQIPIITVVVKLYFDLVLVTLEFFFAWQCNSG
jgi:hypothetical protein